MQTSWCKRHITVCLEKKKKKRKDLQLSTIKDIILIPILIHILIIIITGRNINKN